MMKRLAQTRVGKHWPWILGTIGVYAVIQLMITFGLLTTYWATILQKACIMAIVSLGLNLIYGLSIWRNYPINRYTISQVAVPKVKRGRIWPAIEQVTQAEIRAVKKEDRDYGKSRTSVLFPPGFRARTACPLKRRNGPQF